MYATNNVIANAKAKLTNFKQQVYTYAVRYCGVSWEKALFRSSTYQKNFFVAFNREITLLSPIFSASSLQIM